LEIKKREDIKLQDKWKVAEIYENLERWEADFTLLKEMSNEISSFMGTLSKGEKLLEYLQLDERISRLAEKLLVYAFLRADEDTANTTYQSYKNKIQTYLSELMAKGSFFVPEILSIDEKHLNQEIEKVDGLKIYDILFEKILKTKPHILTTEMEELLAGVSDCLSSPSNIYNMFSNADLKLDKIKDEEGKEIELTEGNYSIYIKSKNREVRKSAFKSLFGSYNVFRNTMATTLISSIKNFSFNARTRKYQNSMEASLKPNNIPSEVYENAIETINKNLDSLHRYVRIKKKLLKLDDIHMFDLYAPLIDMPNDHIEFDEAVDLVTNALASLGKDYLDQFKKGVKEGWIDKYENKNKRSGAYSWGSYDTMPYVLLNYNYTLNDVSTFAHEMGHSLHSYYSRKTQPYIYADYTLFCAEVASTVNECLLINYLIDKEKDKNKKIFLVNQQLEQIRTTVFRQIMFAEFEKITHEKIDSGEPLTADDLSSIYRNLNIKYFGEDMVMDEEIDIEWARISHFYRDFYVYQYATGYSAANAFVNRINGNEKDAVKNYLVFLQSGGSDYSINLLKKAGVDMTTAKPIEDTIKRFNELLDILEEY
jgi:oligoendopeptidase F